MNDKDPRKGPSLRGLFTFVFFLSLIALVAGSPDKPPPPRKAPASAVSVMKVVPRDTPFSLEYVGQTQSSHQVEIRARVNGFLDKRTYLEGSRVDAGQVMFQMDPLPFEAKLKAAQGALDEQKARLKTAQADLARVRPLAAKDALSQKDLDDAVGREQEAAAAVESARAAVVEAREEMLAGSTSAVAIVFGLVFVLLILAAQYESWTLPFSVIFAVPFAILGALLAIILRKITNDVYFQIGLLTLVGLAAKNAILIVEFAVEKHHEGLSLFDAAAEAARLRLRPIVMTSFAFILGCVPLAIATGASANSRHSIGTGVIGGCLAATVIAIYFIPMFFWLLQSASAKLSGASKKAAHEGVGPVPAPEPGPGED